MMTDLGLVTAATFSFRHEAEVAAALLRSEGIAALVQADDEGGLNPGFFSRYGVRVVVAAEERERARRLLAPGEETDDARLVVRPGHVEAMVAHARFCAPEEACGLLAFGDDGELAFVYCLTNTAHSPYRFVIDPGEHFAALGHAERLGWEIAGTFHSHGNGPPVLSTTDVEGAVGPPWIHVVVGRAPGSGREEVRAFTVREGLASEVEISTTGEPGTLRR